MVVVIMQEQQQHHHHQQQQQQNPSALLPQLTANHQSSTTVTSIRSPSSTSAAAQSHRQSLLPAPVVAVLPSGEPVSTAPLNFQLARVRLSDIGPYDGAPAGTYVRAMETLCSSLLKYNAALIELGSEDTALMRCGLEGARLFFRSRAHLGVGKGSRGVYMYRAGRFKI
jgi:hypothetical protein